PTQGYLHPGFIRPESPRRVIAELECIRIFLARKLFFHSPDMTMRLPALTILTVVTAVAVLPPAAAATPVPTPITLDQAMASPDWIGNPVEQAWWGWDGKSVYFKQKRTGSQL